MTREKKSPLPTPCLEDLVIVAGHAAFRREVRRVPEEPERDEHWVLEPYQAGEPPFYIEHIAHGAALAARNPSALLLFSGGRTSPEAGPWSEAATYRAIAQAAEWWGRDRHAEPHARVAARAEVEEHARDSFQNLLFGLCRFQQLAGRSPREVVVVGWRFKRARFELHRAALRIPPDRFRYEGVNDPVDVRAAWRGEAKALRAFLGSRYGASDELAAKRQRRNPHGERHPYSQCPGLADFLAFIADPANGSRPYPGKLPWED